MSDVNTVNSVLSGLQISTKTAEEPQDNELGQSAFLELMIAQMNNQDPLSPQENTEFVAQLAQFSSVEGMERLNNNFDDFAASFMSNQALQASSLVGTQVTVSASQTQLNTGDLVSGIVDIPSSTSDLQISIYDDSGSLVETVPIGAHGAGDMVFRWDGYNFEVDGELLDWNSSHEEGLGAGTYTIKATATVDGDNTSLDTSLSANVNSVTLAADGSLVLNLAGMGPVNVTDVKQFN